MIKSLTSGFAGLLRFSGRDTRAQFWPYAGLVLIGAFAGFGTIMGALTASNFSKVEAFAAENPDQVTVTQSPGSYSISVDTYQPALMPDFGAFFSLMALMIATIVVLLAAAVTRRLHDRGRSGWWAFPVVVFLSLGIGGMAILLRTFMSLPEQSDFSVEGALALGLVGLFLNNVAYIGWLLFLVFLLATDRDPGPNRFGSRLDT